MKVGGRVLKLEGDLTVTPAKRCDTCLEVLEFNDVGILICKNCKV